MPGKLLVSMTTPLWCLAAAEIGLNLLAVIVWVKQRRARSARAARFSLAIVVAVPIAAVIAFEAAFVGSFPPASTPASETAREVAIRLQTLMHVRWICLPCWIIPLLAHWRVRALARGVV